MSIRKKIGIVVLMIIAVITASFYFIFHLFVLQGFNQIEDNIVQQNATRITSQIEDYFSFLISKSADWAHWDETYRFVDDKNQKFLKENITTDAFYSLQIHAIILFNKNGEVIITHQVDFEKKREQKVPEELIAQLSRDPYLFRKYDNLEPKYGFISIKNSPPVLVVMHPVVKSDGTGPVNGTLVFARYLDGDMLKKLNASAPYPLSVEVNSALLSPEFQQIFAELQASNTPFVLSHKNENTIAHVLFRDITGTPAFFFQITVPREIHKQTDITFQYTFWSILIAAIFFGLIVYFFVEKLILNRVILLSNEVKNIKTGNENIRITHIDRHDEISFLAAEIENVLNRLAFAQKDIEKSEKRYMGIIESQKEFIVRIDKDGKCIFMNDAFCKKFGKNKEKIIGQLYDPPVHPEDKNTMKKILINLQKEEKRISFETRMKTKEGWRWISWESYAIKDKKNKILEIQQVGHDITDMKNNEISLKERAEELEKLNKFMVDREIKMKALKDELEELKSKKTKTET